MRKVRGKRENVHIYRARRWCDWSDTDHMQDDTWRSLWKMESTKQATNEIMTHGITRSNLLRRLERWHMAQYSATKKVARVRVNSKIYNALDDPWTRGQLMGNKKSNHLQFVHRKCLEPRVSYSEDGRPWWSSFYLRVVYQRRARITPQHLENFRRWAYLYQLVIQTTRHYLIFSIARAVIKDETSYSNRYSGCRSWVWIFEISINIWAVTKQVTAIRPTI